MSECGECTTCTILRQAKSEIEYRLKNNLLSEPEPVKAEEKMTVDAADVIVDPASEKKWASNIIDMTMPYLKTPEDE